ncbi:hypothetical protein TorRG33x02_126260 [Trema orientale]|uniref:Uncharacterized protein n=1 Tax=Trema orientale TaxID=63057 RepID=A0A2P5F1C0_TREOI|nr:hypothetical protein TorRG33x02_126260 [Trema orientale]
MRPNGGPVASSGENEGDTVYRSPPVVFTIPRLTSEIQSLKLPDGEKCSSGTQNLPFLTVSLEKAEPLPSTHKVDETQK